MKKIRISVILALIIMLSSFSSDKPAYLLYTKDGKKVEYSKMIKQLKDADIVFFGELHNNPISHWLQFEISKDLIVANDTNVILGAEMFESDNQLIINEYLTGLISKSKFEAECRLWPNYKTDYKPLMELAKTSQIPFIATNIPRRYASVVYKKGFEGLENLSKEAKQYIAPLPMQYDPQQDAYKSMLSMGDGMPAHMTQNLPKAQAAKDATMAHFIVQNIEPDHTFIHFEGAYHSDKYQGIIYYLNQYKPNLNIVTITTVNSKDVFNISEEEKALADFIIIVDENMTTTH